MRLLLLNTCGAEGSVALADTTFELPVVADVRMPGRAASEMLVAVVRQAMASHRWSVKDLGLIAVVTGPGSFTGVRVGLSAAKGLTEATGAPMIAISRLALLAAASSRGGIETGRVCALLDAGRDEFYCGQYLDGVELRTSLRSHDEAFDIAAEADEVVVCEQVVYDAFAATLAPVLVAEPSAADAVPFALKRFHEGAFDDPVTLDANYLRRSDEEIFSPSAKLRAS